MKACWKKELDSELEVVCNMYKDDFDKDILQIQLLTLGVHFKQQAEDVPFFLSKTFSSLSLSNGELSLLSQVKCLLQLSWLCQPNASLNDPLVP